MKLLSLLLLACLSLAPSNGLENRGQRRGLKNKKDEMNSEERDGVDTIADIVLSDSNFKTLSPAIALADLFDVLEDEALDMTLFAPDNDAFDRLPIEILGQISSPEYGLHLRDILALHLYIAMALSSSDLVNNAVIPMSQRSGETLRVSIDSGNILLVSEAERNGLVTYVSSAKVVPGLRDLEAVNGVVHAIDRVLLPQFVFTTMVDTIQALAGRFSTLIELMELTSLLDDLSDFEGTILAPNNDGFAAAGVFLESLREPENNERLSNILKYHLLPQVFNYEVIPDVAELPTVLGPTVMFDPNKVTENEMILGLTRQPKFEGLEIVDLHLFATGIIYEMPFLLTVPTILDEMRDQGRTQFDTFLQAAAVSTPRLTSLLANRGLDQTIFAPSNDAFDNLPAGVLETLLLPAFGKHLYDLLAYHTSVGNLFYFEDLSDGQTLYTLQRLNETLTISANNSGTFVETVTDRLAPRIASEEEYIVGANGVVHELDGILFPRFLFKDVLQVLDENRAQFTIFIDFLEVAGFLPYLRSFSGTVLAPSNDAFLALGNETLQALRSDRKALSAILSYHLVPDTVINNSVQGVNSEFSTLYGPILLLTNQFTPTFNNIRSPDFYLYGAGIVYELDGVMELPSVLDIIRMTADFSTLESLLDQTRLSTIIDIEDRIFTIFAPTNRAFSSLPAAILRDYRTAPFGLHLFDMLAYHMHLDSALFSEFMKDGDRLPTLQRQGEQLEVNITVISDRRVLSTLGDFQPDSVRGLTSTWWGLPQDEQSIGRYRDFFDNHRGLKNAKGDDRDDDRRVVEVVYSLITDHGRVVDDIPQSNIEFNDLTATNGVVHGIDRANLPRFMYQNSLTTLQRFDDRFSVLAELALIAGLEGPLTTLRGTLLAPSNEAFKNVCVDLDDDERRLKNKKSTSKEKRDDDCLNSEQLITLLSYHVVPNNVFNYEVGETGDQLRTLLEDVVTVDFLTRGIVGFQGAVNKVDSHAYFLWLSGVVYEVDDFLIPSEMASLPELLPSFTNNRRVLALEENSASLAFMQQSYV